MQVRAMVRLGANACIVGRNSEKVERVAKDIQPTRPGSRVLGFGSMDVSFQTIQSAVTNPLKSSEVWILLLQGLQEIFWLLCDHCCQMPSKP